MMKTSNFFRLTALIFFLLTAIVILPDIAKAAPEASPTTATQTDTKARVNFKSPLSVSEVKNLAAKNGLRLETLEGDFTVGNLPLYDFYFVKPDMDAKAIEDDYKVSRLAYFKDLLNGESQFKDEQRAELALQFEELKKAVQRNDAGDIKIKKVTIVGNEKDVQDLSQNSEVDQVNIIKEKQEAAPEYPNPKLQQLQNKSERINKQASKQDAIGATSMMTQTLPSVPRYGFSQTQASSITGQRETTQWMQWENVSFGTNQTYEHELFFDNFDGQTYLDGRSTLPVGCFPFVEYIGTSFPAESRPYMDTRVKPNGLCETGELEFTVGAFQANKLQANTWYHTYHRTLNGNANTDRFWVAGQVGHQNPTICAYGYETWCSYGDDPSIGDRHVDFLQAWNKEVPGTMFWELGVRFCENNRAGSYGRCLDLGPGTHDLTDYNFNDILTTIRIGMGIQWRVTVFEHVDPNSNYCYGNGWRFTSNGDRWEINLYDGGLNFNDKASCVIVEFN